MRRARDFGAAIATSTARSRGQVDRVRHVEQPVDVDAAVGDDEALRVRGHARPSIITVRGREARSPSCPPRLSATRERARPRGRARAGSARGPRGAVSRGVTPPTTRSGGAGGAASGTRRGTRRRSRRRRSRAVLAERGVEAGQREVAERVRGHVGRDLVDRVRARDELLPRRRVDAVVAGPGGGRRADAEVDLRGARRADHLHDLAARRAAHDRVVHHHDPLAGEHAAQRVQLELHAEVPDRLLRLDERAADVVGADEPHRERDPGALGVADRRGDARVRHRDDEVRRDRVLLRELLAERVAHLVDRLAEEHRVRPREVDVLEDAAAEARRGRLRREEPLAAEPVAVDDDELAGLDLAHVLRLDEVERGGLAREHPAALEPAEHERAEAHRIARADERLGREEHASSTRPSRARAPRAPLRRAAPPTRARPARARGRGGGR